MVGEEGGKLHSHLERQAAREGWISGQEQPFGACLRG